MAVLELEGARAGRRQAERVLCAARANARAQVEFVRIAERIVAELLAGRAAAAAVQTSAIQPRIAGVGSLAVRGAVSASSPSTTPLLVSSSLRKDA